MISYPNQKLYIINKKIEEGDLFIMLKWEDYCQAARELSPSALNLYMYLAKNQDKYNFALSSSDFCNWSGLGIAAYRTAFEELEKQGYLIINGSSTNNYIFYDKAQKEDEAAEKDNINITIPTEKVEEVQQLQEQVAAGFVF